MRGNLSRYASRLAPGGSQNSNIGGRLQIKLGFEPSTLQLIVTIVCAADLTFRPNGAARNPYAKVRSSAIYATFAINIMLSCSYSFFLLTRTSQSAVPSR